MVVALDVGGTSIKAGLIDAQGAIVREARRPTGVSGGPENVIERICAFAADLVAGQPVRAIGLGVPGVVDSAAGIARFAANLGPWRDVPFVALLQDRLSVPVALGHDVRLGALAEAQAGAGVGSGSVYFMAIGTGIAGGLVTDGRVDNGASGQAGEVGHLVVRPGGPECGCGNRGCLEALASASRIGRIYSARTGVELSAREVADKMLEGDPIAAEVWNEALDCLADAMATVTILQDPEVFVIGGGLSLAGDLLTRPLAERLAQRLTFRSAPQIAVGRLGDRAGLVGASIIAWDAAAQHTSDPQHPSDPQHTSDPQDTSEEH